MILVFEPKAREENTEVPGPQGSTLEASHHTTITSSLHCQHKQLRGEGQMAGVGVPEHQILSCLSELPSLLKWPAGANKTYC